MSQPELIGLAPRFDGATFEPERDQARLTGQIERIYGLMKDERWRTVHEIGLLTRDPEPSISAQLRNLRKARFGGHDVQRRYREGVYEFRVVTHV